MQSDRVAHVAQIQCVDKIRFRVGHCYSWAGTKGYGKHIRLPETARYSIRIAPRILNSNLDNYNIDDTNDIYTAI